MHAHVMGTIFLASGIILFAASNDLSYGYGRCERQGLMWLGGVLSICLGFYFFTLTNP